MSGVLSWLHRRAVDFASILLGLMFMAFIVQIVFRYFINCRSTGPWKSA